MPLIVPPPRLYGLRPLFCLALCSQLLWPTLVFADPVYDQLVLEARAGTYAPALTHLRQVPADQLTAGLVSDHLQIASWAGLDAEVVDVYETQARGRVLPTQALTATARAYRNLKRWDDAIRLYRQALEREPQNPDLQLGLALTQADAGQPAEAVRRARELVAAKPDDATRRLALGYALTRAAQPYDALFEFDQAFVRAGDKPQVLREYVLALQRARLPEPALRLARQHPGLLDPVSLRRLEGDVAAERVRLTELATRSEKERYVIADRALADYDRLIAAWASDPAARDDVTRWRIDRLGALKARARTAEVIDEYHKLTAEGVTIPTYALRWVASSHLDQRKPEIASDLYRQVLAAPDADVSDRVDDNTALYYALLESDRPEEAQQIADELARNQKPRVELKGLPVGNPNDEWMDAQQLAAQSGTYSADLAGSEQRLANLVEQAPGNLGLRLSEANLYLARKWPRRAEGLLKETEAQAPRDIGLEVAQGHTAQDLQEWRQLDALTDDVVQRFPENRQVQRLARQRQVHDMAELRVETYGGKSYGGGNSGAGAVSGSKDFGIETVLYSPPINEDWRLFGGLGYATGDFQEGTGHHRWQRVGVERRTRDMTLEAEVSNHSYGFGDKQGARLAIARDIDDHWQYGGSLEYLSANTPLRALNSDIYANGGSAFLRWRANESREWRLALSPSHFSDGNNRFEALLTGREGVYATPHVQVDLGLEVGSSHNTKEDTPYFNPKADLTVLPTVNINHVLYQRYETVWSQQFQVGAGTYSQRDHSTGGIGLLSYGQRVIWNDVFEAGANLSVINRPYDGDRETDLRLLLDLTYRF
ncbi:MULTISPECIES: poly-beta-1,6 N-acetyl-D-glucosamine export porin PgaA [Pseudomonas]|uniref:poly-beta-1,6 N-acetyl-D-glucosamine export porin PgaA n=1 Tax=Pseudomonas TaxID=286 RepID=UPI000B3559EC|nr:MULTISPECIES: poly-beta-1,6 N-acetyl-D-glucosamine export porin PgaA [Pseudomonas]PMY65907.1 poly-beta-1,6 N-acetyl-D-glucosamine export porin PgaA [Pseudomonas sp. FW305-25]PMY71138.1 poly-beta-1,6 N-acetyl-D-glucosamine export porin PgaA [Pseudomonas sp. FW126-L8]PNA80810.1 poly-beta-1,6 N-acetyl-D-glucosamine export porin PgaA [Pseudomonas sp. FW305-76]